MSAPQFFRLLCSPPCSSATQRFHQAERFCRSGCAMRPPRSAQLDPQAASSWEDGLSSTRFRSPVVGDVPLTDAEFPLPSDGQTEVDRIREAPRTIVFHEGTIEE